MEWVDRLICSLLNKPSGVLLEPLPKRAFIVVSTEDEDGLIFDSKGERADRRAAFAVRCSSSIPYFFWEIDVDGVPVFDGGLSSNYPYRKFIDYEQKNGRSVAGAIGIYLGKVEESKFARRSQFARILRILLRRDEISTVNDNKGSTIIIDTHPIGTIDFGLTETEKQFLVAQGQSCALEFLLDKKFPDGPTIEDWKRKKAEADSLRRKVEKSRRGP